MMVDRDRAVIYGIDTQIGLTVVRELAAHGVEVYGVAQSERGVGLYSRTLERGWVVGSEEDPLDLVNRIAEQFGVPYLLVVGEAEIMLFNAQRARLRGIRPLIPEPAKMDIVLSKARVAELARGAGIPTPRSIQISDPREIESVARTVVYPVVLKWANPHEVAPALREHRLPLEKIRYCYDAAELTSGLRRYDRVKRFPEVQSFAPGYGLGQMLFMHRGHALLRFQHRRIHENPPEGGASSLCESMAADANDALMEKSIVLLRRIEWEGPAMVEYRYDPTSGAATLMEINGRFWGSLPLAHYAEAPFAWLTYSVLGKGEIPPLHPYRVGLRCGSLVPELKRLHRIVVRPDLIQNRTLKFSAWKSSLDFLVNQLSPFRRHYVFSWSDPMPAVADVWFGLKRVLRHTGRRH